MIRSRHLVPCAALAAALAAAAPARANGRMPATVAVHFAPNNATDIYLQVTFGLLESHDGGATWRWVCEEAIGYSGTYDPDYVVTPSGALFASTFDGLKIRRDACTFGASPLGTTFISSVTATSEAAGVVYAAAADATTKDSKIYKSVDDGAHFNPTGATTPGDEAWWTSLEVAPSNPSIVYATGYRFPGTGQPKQVTMYRSDDAGATWKPLSTAGFTVSTNSDIDIVAISPDDPAFVLAKVTFRNGAGVGDAIYRSTNSGASWTMVKAFDDTSPGVVIRHTTQTPASTKAEVVLGTQFSGTWDSTDGGQTFTQVQPTLQIGCMAEKDGTLWTCANDLPPNSMALGKGTAPTAWTPVLHFKDIQGTTSCAAGTVEYDKCNLMRWCTLRDQLGIIANPTNCASLGADAGTVDGAPPDAAGTKGKGTGCCSAGDPRGAALLTLVVAVPLLRRRRRAARA